MINYGFSIKGKSHSTRNMACQDANKVIQLNNGCSIGLVADGVGSAKSSDIGAKIAVEKAGEYCSENINSGMNLDQQLQVLKDSFSYALNSIKILIQLLAERFMMDKALLMDTPGMVA